MALGRPGYSTWRQRQHDAELANALTPQEAFREALAIDMAELEHQRVPFYDWAIRVPEPKAGRLDFDSYPFQLELYQEAAADPEAVVKKACLAPETRVLRADLRWVPIGSIKPGDEVVAVDEEPQMQPNGRRRPRRMRTALVEGVRWTTADTTYRVTLANGEVITASGNHPLLWRGSGGPAWQRVDKMRVGDHVRQIAKPWGAAGYEDGWMGGILDGEGSFRRRPVGGLEVVVSQRHGEVYDRARDYLDRHGVHYYEQLKQGGYDGSGEVGRLVVNRASDVFGLMGRARPERFVHRRWWEGMGLPNGAWGEIVEIEPLGASGEVVDLQTSESTFIAEGIVSHNTQVGVSAYLVRWTMYWADTKGLVALYVFPTRDHVYDFSDSRMKPAIEESEYLRSRISPGDVMNKGLKKIGLGFVYFRGSETKRGLDSVDADVLALDEYDTLTQANVGDAERRISGSRTGLVRRVGVPTINDFGISREFDKSDKRRWFVKCEGCGKRQYPRFKENVAVKEGEGIKKGTPAHEVPYDDLTRYYLACEDCRKPLDVLKGEWVAERPERPVRGYHMPRLIVGHTNLGTIVEASKDTEPYKKQVHHNKDLAEAFEVEGGRLTREEIKAAIRDFSTVDYVRTDNLVTMGVDVASARNLHVRVSEHLSDSTKKALWIGEIEFFRHDTALDLDDLMQRYGVNMACIDHLPEQRLARSFAERFPGRVYLARYAPPDADKVFEVDEDMRVAKIKRVAALDAVIDKIRLQHNLLPRNLPHDYADHMVAVVRQVERDEFDKVKVVYTSTGADDYMHAEAYDVAAKEAWLVRQVVDEAHSGAEVPLEEFYEFDRSTLGEPDADVEYSAGPDEGDYRFD